MKRALVTLALLIGAAYGLLYLVWRPVPTGGDFTLRSADGPVTLRDVRGRVAILYFGYMSCPDICPTSLSVWKTALTSLRPEEMARVQPIFISVDPERDTPANIKGYVGFFHPSILGVTGDAAEVARVAKAYGARYAKVKTSSAMVYTVDHTADTYVVGPRGQLSATVPHGAPPEDIVKAVRAALQEPQ